MYIYTQAWSDELASLAGNSSVTCPPNGTQALSHNSSLGSVTQVALTLSTMELDDAGFMYGQLLQIYWVDLAEWPNSCSGGDCEPYLQVCVHVYAQYMRKLVCI